MSANNFFVYGSLSEGLVHFSKIKDFVIRSQPGQVLGQAFRLKVGFPTLVDQGADIVPGHLLWLKPSEILLTFLDQFHGVNPEDPQKSLYFRVEKTVVTETESHRAQVYVLNPAKLPKEAQYIEGGDWKKSLKTNPALPEKLTERQKTYVVRLGTCSGRDIVPIDLGLYRELMKLELIVDKGRRLALSKLGHEVLKYLT